MVKKREERRKEGFDLKWTGTEQKLKIKFLDPLF
jgi:hypothetical protein